MMYIIHADLVPKIQSSVLLGVILFDLVSTQAALARNQNLR
jgi:hypothetical protein